MNNKTGESFPVHPCAMLYDMSRVSQTSRFMHVINDKGILRVSSCECDCFIHAAASTYTHI